MQDSVIGYSALEMSGRVDAGALKPTRHVRLPACKPKQILG